MGKITDYTTDFTVSVDFEKAGVYLEDLQVEGRVRFCEDGFDYDGPQGPAYHNLGWGLDEIKNYTVSAYSERRKAWVTVSNRLAEKIFSEHEDYIKRKIEEQQGE